MKAAILHNTINTAGGGERVCLAMIKTLRERFDAQIDLYTVDKTDWAMIRDKFGTDWLPSNINDKSIYDLKTQQGKFTEHFLIKRKIPLFGIYQRLLISEMAKHMIPKKNYDIVINTFGDAIGFRADFTYIYFPIHLLGGHVNNIISSKYTSSLFWRLYFEPYRLLTKRSALAYIRDTFPLFVSHFSMQFCEDAWKSNRGIVLHPPVDDKQFSVSCGKSFDERSPSVITISRLVPEKGLELIPSLAEALPEIDFHIVGGTNQYSHGILKMLNAATNRFSNLFLHKDATLAKLQELCATSRLYLHTMKNEHFGIAPVEAMNAALPVLVHASGGAYIDITEYGKYGMYYNDTKDAIEQIKFVVNDRKAWNYYSSKSLERAKEFTLRNFMDKFERCINNGKGY